jgi:hypothetical protein
MQNPLYKKPTDPTFQNVNEQNRFTKETQSILDLLIKEMTVNRENQNLLAKRILIMTEELNNIPASDPQYSMMAIQIQMDKIELDELKTREQILSQKINPTN